MGDWPELKQYIQYIAVDQPLLVIKYDWFPQ